MVSDKVFICVFLVTLELFIGTLIFYFFTVLPKEDLYHILLKFASWLWWRRFFENFSVFLLFCYYLPLENGVSLPLNKLESPRSRFMPSLVKIGPLVLEWITGNQKRSTDLSAK
jgi:hypothetical protein